MRKIGLTQFVQFNAAASSKSVSNCKNLQKVIHFCDFLLLFSFLILPSQRVIFVVNDYGLCIHMSFQLPLWTHK